jgi:hypothetical protein
MIDEKKPETKISLHCPFKYATFSSYTNKGPVPWVLFLFWENLEKAKQLFNHVKAYYQQKLFLSNI